ncbi:MAG: hypothetical protein VKJ06_00520 [Vampirovibrionales bacterium]|nr:hypothetical protein [Vampirovibrionales bacterium]
MTNPNPTNTTEKRRWYDLEPEVSQAFNALQQFPDDILHIIAEGLVDFAEREFKAKELQQNRRTLGAPKVLALFQSQKRRRVPDRVASFLKISNYMMLLSVSARKVMSANMMELIGFIAEYLQSCKLAKSAVMSDDIGVLTRSYLRSGKDEARRFLAEVRERFAEKVHYHAKSGPGTFIKTAAERDMRLGNS